MVMGEPQRVAGTEGRSARRQLVQRRPQGIEIRTLIDRARGAARLLRREVRQGTHDLVVGRELRTNLRKRRCQCEIDQARVSAGPFE